MFYISHREDEILEELRVEDKVMAVNPIGDNYKIWVIHQAASRWLRNDIATQAKKFFKEMETVDLDELQEKIETEAVKIEDAYLKLAFQNPDGTSAIPVFDFEIN